MPSLLLVATHNANKTTEIRDILSDHFETVTDLTTLPDLVPPEETGSTFAENSAIKALAASEAMPEAFVLADDSGLEVDALGGAPGVHSSRYSGEEATDASNREKLLHDLARPEFRTAARTARTARFRCALTIAKGGAVIAQFDGTVEGEIAETATGEEGFGYDPVFIPEGYEASFGVLPASVKNELSHRAKALERVRDWLEHNPV